MTVIGHLMFTRRGIGNIHELMSRYQEESRKREFLMQEEEISQEGQDNNKSPGR